MLTKKIRAVAVGVLASTALLLAPVASRAAELLWYGQSAFRITTPGGKVIVIDPFITKTPVPPADLKDLSKVGPVDLILVTHGHFDHTADVAALARMTGAKVAMNADMGTVYQQLGLVPGDQLIRFNKGGPIQPLGDGITVTMVHAEHSSTVVYEGKSHPGGEPCGYIVRMEDGKTFYHAGDTDVFGDMAWIGSYYHPDVAFLPVGGHFTMDPAHAAYAERELIKAPVVVPMHYGTFPPLKGTPEQFEQALGGFEAEVVVMKPGETRAF
ncbi:metal-dependent hydrolase [Tistlia consotensis]|uniref:UPF0173 metal-dependent hydrolase SAMN05428998_101601 n=1 Tax=Tistlia consotensis USBA 355 TaxID=560819 RepID=A0A1Y6B5Q8_9PROT|nr:metal-dependent hydrolase [Tistlia consotensis]SME93733.1 L-ascorbate metabolism protein UlaG, beta-lactamase superfamily [Tistlia consotensis USBA 355]